MSEAKERIDESELSQLLCVGSTNDKRNVTKLNNELFTKGREMMEASAGEGNSLWHIGWYDFGRFIDYLEWNYDIKRKDT